MQMLFEPFYELVMAIELDCVTGSIVATIHVLDSYSSKRDISCALCS